MSRTYPARRHDRRTFLLGAGAVVLSACSSSEPLDDAIPSSSGDESSTSSADVASSSEPTADGSGDAGGEVSGVSPLTASMFDELAVCTLTASATAGPFPTKSPLERRDVHEDYPGHPLRLGIRVVDEACTPIPGAKVEIWHTDATGDYSEYDDNGEGKDEGEGSTFCRGIQTADDDGILEFQTIYPGWYPGRAVHIHTRTYIESDVVLTSQLYLDESYTEAVYATGEYAPFGSPDTTWADDRLSGDPIAEGSIISVSEAQTTIGPGSLGLVNLAVISS